MSLLTQVVFGGATGIGRAIVQRLARRPGRLIVLDRNETELAKLPKLAEGPAKLECVTTDVLDTDGLATLPARVLKDGAALDVLAYNAGIYPTVTVADSSPKDWDLVSGLNARACYFAIRAFLPNLRQSKRGTIVLTSSITGNRTGATGLAIYGASKAAMNGMMRSMALEFAKDGITINAVEPGVVGTEPVLKGLGPQNEAKMKLLIPLGRLADPDDIAASVEFLSSENARYITGQSIILDGGMTLPEWPENIDFNV
ncbi:MAG: SDR family oxidoreductase [Rhizobiales bacterium]|nr:SDR family oxidoreductase [Hyphomicrobiales bacterium]